MSAQGPLRQVRRLLCSNLAQKTRESDGFFTIFVEECHHQFRSGVRDVLRRVQRL